MSINKICPNCGAESNPSERFCPNCGTRLPEQDAAINPTIRIDQPPFNAPSGGQGSAYPPPGSAPTPPRKGMPVWLIVLISLGGLAAVLCVAAIAIISGLAFLGGKTSQVFSSVNSSLDVATGPTTASSRRTPVSNPADVAPTRDLVLRPTKTPTRSTATPAGDPILASARQVFRDEFADNSNSWVTGQVSDIETDTIEDGVFKVLWTGKGATYETHERDVTNFVADLDCKAERGGTDAGCGFIFGQKTDVGYYRFRFYEDSYDLSVVSSNDATPTKTLVKGDPSRQVNSGDWNHLRVVRQDNKLSLYLNDKLLDTASDSTYTSGQVGVWTSCYNEQGGVEVWFDNFTIWELP